MEIVKLVDETYRSVDLNEHDSHETVIHYLLHRKDVDMHWSKSCRCGISVQSSEEVIQEE